MTTSTRLFCNLWSKLLRFSSILYFQPTHGEILPGLTFYQLWPLNVNAGRILPGIGRTWRITEKHGFYYIKWNIPHWDQWQVKHSRLQDSVWSALWIQVIFRLILVKFLIPLGFSYIYITFKSREKASSKSSDKDKSRTDVWILHHKFQKLRKLINIANNSVPNWPYHTNILSFALKKNSSKVPILQSQWTYSHLWFVPAFTKKRNIHLFARVLFPLEH